MDVEMTPEEEDRWILHWIDGEDVAQPDRILLDMFISRFPEHIERIEAALSRDFSRSADCYDGTIYANLHPSVQAQLDRIEAMLGPLTHGLMMTTEVRTWVPNYTEGRCSCGHWAAEIDSPNCYEFIRSKHVEHLADLGIPYLAPPKRQGRPIEGNSNAGTPQDPNP